MDVDRETLVKFGLPAVATTLFVVGIIVVGASFGQPPTNGTETPTASPGVQLSETGGMALLGLMVVFIIALGIAGAVVGARLESTDGEGTDESE